MRKEILTSGLGFQTGNWLKNSKKFKLDHFWNKLDQRTNAIIAKILDRRSLASIVCFSHVFCYTYPIGKFVNKSRPELNWQLYSIRKLYLIEKSSRISHMNRLSVFSNDKLLKSIYYFYSGVSNLPLTRF